MMKGPNKSIETETETQYFREMHVDVHLKLVDIYRRFLIHSRVNLRLGSQMNRLLDNDE